MKRKLTAAISIMLILLMLPAFAETAYILETSTAYVKPDTSSKSVTLKAGTSVEVLAQKSGWAQIRLKGKTGYIPSSALTFVTTYSGKTVYTSESTLAYKSITSSSPSATIPAGTELKLQATAGDWALVKLGSKKGYVKQSYLTTTAPAIPSETAAPTPVPTNGTSAYTAYVREDRAKVYASYSTASEVLGTLNQNAQVAVTAEKSGWCAVEANGRTAYMRSEDLSGSKIEASATEEPTAAPTVSSTAAGELKYGDTGDAVKALQTRLKELGYFTGNIGGNYLEATQAAVIAFQRQAGLSADGVAGEKTLKALASSSAPKATAVTTSTTASTSSASASGSSTVTPARGTAKEMDWWTSDIQSIFARGTIAQITDIETGLSWRVQRKGGTNHADVQPLTAADTAAMKKACGSWSWNRRAIWVTINGVNYAASMNCMPHGSGSITNNNFDGHHCIHFTNSRTHGTNKVCPLHQAAIKKAAAATR